MNLTTNQRAAVEVIDGPKEATAEMIAEVLGYESTSGVYDLLRRAEESNPSLVFESDDDGVWTYQRVAVDGGTPADEPQTNRVPTAQKQTVTKTANDFLSELESDLRERLAYYEPTTADLPTRSGHRDIVMFRTDDHFGDVRTAVDLQGEKEVTHDSATAEERVFEHRDDVLAFKERLEGTGVMFDTAHLLLNGDHVTNESIYEGQAHEIDSTLREQVRQASRVYLDVIRSLADEFPAVQVVCQHGNHGELRTGAQSTEANADDLMFDALDLALRQSDVENVRLITNHVDTHTEFEMRGHRGYLRHGQAGLGHIGTNSGIKRWQSWLQSSIDKHDDTGWDVGYWGHFHELKCEPVSGRQVLMGGTLLPAGDYADSLGIASGRPGAWTHTVTDDEPVDLLRPVYFE